MKYISMFILSLLLLPIIVKGEINNMDNGYHVIRPNEHQYIEHTWKYSLSDLTTIIINKLKTDGITIPEGSIKMRFIYDYSYGSSSIVGVKLEIKEEVTVNIIK